MIFSGSKHTHIRFGKQPGARRPGYSIGMDTVRIFSHHGETHLGGGIELLKSSDAHWRKWTSYIPLAMQAQVIPEPAKMLQSPPPPPIRVEVGCPLFIGGPYTGLKAKDSWLSTKQG